MTREQILERMDIAARQDRERFFKFADTMNLQPKYIEYLAELEELKQGFRNMTKIEGYPNIDWPPALPEWFPKVNFASAWEKDIFIEQQIDSFKNLKTLPGGKPILEKK